MRATIFAVVALLAVLTAGILVAGATVGSRPVPGPASLVVHEWGTFSSLSGADGRLLRFRADNTDLPGFVHRALDHRKGVYAGTVSLETPVLYFYTDRHMTAFVEARFPTGEFTEWFPQANLMQRASILTWPEVRVHPQGPVQLPVSAGDNHYYAAREAQAAPLEVASKQGQVERREQEGFLFYRGVGDLKPPLFVTARGQGAFTLRVDGKESVETAFLIDADAHRVRFCQVGPIAAGALTSAKLPAGWSKVETLQSALLRSLQRSGLYAKEARAMVKTWQRTWFDAEGTRVLYVLPTSWTEGALPLRVMPRPDTLVRVLVGRHDILTPEREQAINRLVAKLKSGSTTERASASESLARLGRLAYPVRERTRQ